MTEAAYGRAFPKDHGIVAEAFRLRESFTTCFTDYVASSKVK